MAKFSMNKINFAVYSVFVLFGLNGAILFFVLSVAFAVPFLMFCSVVCLGSGILAPIIIHRSNKPEKRSQTILKDFFKDNYRSTKKKPMAFVGNSPPKRQEEEPIPQVEIIEEDDE